tara:strand:+ start:735 stop:1064 length:330 start_codon:yes stop_codon:yes gene_type:complete
MNLVITSKIACDPPSEGLYFRHLTMVAKHDLSYNILLESEKESIDFYYDFLKKRGWYDYMDGIVTPEEKEEGVRLDTELKYPLTILTPHIRYENILNLMGQIKSMRDLF